LLGTIGAVDRLSLWPVELRAGLIGAGVGAMAWFAPGLVPRVVDSAVDL
jgi:chloride channel protein, CIC family